MTREVQQALRQWSEEAAEVHGFRLWDVEIPQQGRWLIRVYMDMPDAAPGEGITIKECAEISRYLEAIFDADERVPDVYVLEVSSPGIERPLKTLEHVGRVVSENVELVLHEPVKGRSKVVGALLAQEGSVLTIEIDDEEIEIDWDEVARAKLKFDFSAKSGEQ